MCAGAVSGCQPLRPSVPQRPLRSRRLHCWQACSRCSSPGPCSAQGAGGGDGRCRRVPALQIDTVSRGPGSRFLVLGAGHRRHGEAGPRQCGDSPSSRPLPRAGSWSCVPVALGTWPSCARLTRRPGGTCPLCLPAPAQEGWAQHARTGGPSCTAQAAPAERPQSWRVFLDGCSCLSAWGSSPSVFTILPSRVLETCFCCSVF